MELNISAGRKKKEVCHDSGQKNKTFFIHSNMISRFEGDISLWFFTYHFNFSLIKSKKIFKKFVVWMSNGIFCRFSCFFHTIIKVLKLSAINK